HVRDVDVGQRRELAAALVAAVERPVVFGRIGREGNAGGRDARGENGSEHEACRRIIMRRAFTFAGEVMRSSAFVVRAGAVVCAAVALQTSLVSQTQTIRIHANTLLDGAGKVVRNATVVVQGSKISAIETGNNGTATYNLGQLTILPGMIDVH